MALADTWDSPLVLADGTKIDPSNGRVLKEKKERPTYVEIPSGSEAQAIVSRTRRSISELPVPAQQMNTLAIVLFYSMYGLSNQDISIATDIPIENIRRIQKLEEYKTISKNISDSILEHEAADIRQFFQQKARAAADQVVDAMEEGGVLGFKAAQDILDRAGHRPVDVVDHRHTMENSLRIEYVEKRANTDIPTIDAKFKVLKDGDCT